MNSTHGYLRLGSRIDWAGVIYAGLIAGAIFFFIEILLLWATGLNNPWEFPQNIAAIVLGPDILIHPPNSRLPLMLVASAVHIALSILFTAILAALIYARGTAISVLIGIAFGALLYLFNFHVLVALFYWFAELQHWVTLIGHAVFGATAAWAYKAFTASGTRIIKP